MDKIFETYKNDATFSVIREAGEKLTKFQQDFTDAIIAFKKSDYIGWRDIFPNDAITGGSSEQTLKRADALKKKIKKEINPVLIKYFKDSFIDYVKKSKEAFSGYETLMLALDLEKNPTIFKFSDYDLKAWGGDMAADRIAVSLMYGGDRLKAHIKYGNIPVRQWADLMKKNANDLWGIGTLDQMADEVGIKNAKPEDAETVVELFRKKYKI